MRFATRKEKADKLLGMQVDITTERLLQFLSSSALLCIFWIYFGLVSLFNGISTLFRLFNAKAILLEEQLWNYLTHTWEDKGVHTFPKGICPKVKVIARLEYELAFYDSAVHRFNHYTTRTSPESTLKVTRKWEKERKIENLHFSDNSNFATWKLCFFISITNEIIFIYLCIIFIFWNLFNLDYKKEILYKIQPSLLTGVFYTPNDIKHKRSVLCVHLCVFIHNI